MQSAKQEKQTLPPKLVRSEKFGVNKVHQFYSIAYVNLLITVLGNDRSAYTSAATLHTRLDGRLLFSQRSAGEREKKKIGANLMQMTNGGATALLSQRGGAAAAQGLLTGGDANMEWKDK